ncbi:MAG: hypothetical protein OEM58_06585 [Nitrospirota bacterium]|nr:hypothetical protein [Nitrospirota bacterium]
MRIICTGKIANTTVGHIDHIMAYAVGFQKLGHEVYVMESIGSNRCIDPNHHHVPFQHWEGRVHFENVMKSYGLWPRCCLIYKQGEATHGMSFAKAVKVAQDCDLLITRSGQIHKVPDIFEPPRLRAYFDGNPGHTQLMFHQQGAKFEPLDRYEYLFTLGLNIGRSSCSIPTNGHHWFPMPRPVFLPMWPMKPPSHDRFSTISSWKGRSTLQWDGKDSGEKADNWLQFLDLPDSTGQLFEIALKMEDSRHSEDRTMFQKKGWFLTDPTALHNLQDYQTYIGQSRGEFSVAHNRYVEFTTGWFSDRSALYLASGKPVLVQSTGIEEYLPTGTGLLTFTHKEEAAAGIEAINHDYATHYRAAREIAEEYFDSNLVLSRILKTMGCLS